MFCRAFLPQINQWVRLSLEPAGETFHQLEIRTLYWSRSPCMFDITETSPFLVTVGSQSIPLSIGHKGVSSLQWQHWEVMPEVAFPLFFPPTCQTVFFVGVFCNSLNGLHRHCLQMQWIFSLFFFIFGSSFDPKLILWYTVEANQTKLTTFKCKCFPLYRAS